MFSKFSVLSKFYKYFNFKQRGLRHMFRSEYMSPMPSRRCFTKNSTNILIPEGTNKIVFAKNDKNFEISRNMSSSHNNKGDGQNIEKFSKTNKNLIEKHKKRVFRRRSKVKGLKTSQTKCKRCNKQKHLNNEILINKITWSEDMPIRGVINNQSILESQLPPKKVHVEFMESQNLKDFNLNKGPESNNTNNIKQNVIDINITPIGTSNDNQNIPMLKSGWKGSFKADNISQQSMHPIEAQFKINKNITKGIKTKPFKNKLREIYKDFIQNNTIKDQSTEDTIITRKKSFLNENFSNIDDKISNQNNTVSKMSENIRILYQAHPKRKTKIKISKRIQSEKVKQGKLLQEHKQDKTKSAIKILDEPNSSFKRRGILFPTEPGDYLNLKIKSKHFKCDMIKPFVTLRKGILFPTNNSGNQIKRPFKPKPDLNNNEIKLYGGTPKTIKQVTFLSNNLNDTLKPPKNRKEKTIKNSSYIRDSSINKLILSTQSNKDNISSKSSSVSFKNKFNEYISTDKLKDELNTINQVSQGSRPSPKRSNNIKHGTGTIKINKLTKYKRSSRSGKRGGSRGGDGEDNKTINSETTTTKARPSKFWRTISIAILPLLFGLIIYTMSNIGAVDMLKRMRDARSTEDPLSILPTFYGKRSKTKQSYLNEIEVEEEKDEDDNLNDNNIEDHVKDPRLGEA